MYCFFIFWKENKEKVWGNPLNWEIRLTESDLLTYCVHLLLS